MVTGDTMVGDGVVELTSTACANMSDQLVLPVHHALMPWNIALAQQVVYFLQQGRFARNRS